MRLLFTAFIMLLFIQAVLANDVIIFNEKSTGFKKIISIQNKNYLITQTAIYLISKNKIETVTNLKDSCNDATAYNNNILLACNNGMYLINANNKTIKPFMQNKVQGKIDYIVSDKENKIWFANEFSGCYKITNDSTVDEIVNAPTIYALTATPDSNVWIGTNIGMYKISLSKNEIYRFEEEGIEGFELPDNYVEKIYADETSNIWAVMPRDIAFIAAGNDEDAPDYTYIGSHNNTVFDICKIPGGKRAYIFATKEGLIYTADLIGENFNHSGEIHQTFKEAAYTLNDEAIEKPASLKDFMVMQIKIINGQVYFITDGGLWNVSVKKVLKFLNDNKS